MRSAEIGRRTAKYAGSCKRPDVFDRTPTILARRPHSRLDLDKSYGHFAPVAIRNPDDRSSHDRGVCIENVLDLAGIDILAAADDHVLAPALNAAISALVETPQIAGVKPALGIDCRSRRFGIVEIVFHDGVSASADFADLSDRHNRAGFRADDLDFGLRHGPADR